MMELSDMSKQEFYEIIKNKKVDYNRIIQLGVEEKPTFDRKSWYLMPSPEYETNIMVYVDPISDTILNYIIFVGYNASNDVTCIMENPISKNICYYPTDIYAETGEDVIINCLDCITIISQNKTNEADVVFDNIPEHVYQEALNSLPIDLTNVHLMYIGTTLLVLLMATSQVKKKK